MSKIRQFLSSRYGSDQLSVALAITGCVFILMNRLSGWLWASVVAWLCLAACIVRMLSNNPVKRRAENHRFLNWWVKVASFWKLRLRMVKEWKTHRYLRCPACHQQLRVPRGKGKISITCTKCRHAFVKKV
ncbi:hypothetical protein U6B65_01050 [Oscillospiraceae bacterium MB08-C2-2]|nr:hypothetical protein U6B65_01050 [Oscillospiraceae bacterium MB08-C2-2]